jgi:6-pyruvoyltetrahydropterin/6-carboxytetrahydropterin synthase
MYEILVEEKFDAAHCLRGYSGNCERLHGHTYRVQALLRVEKLDEIGMAVDFRKVRTVLREAIALLDHQYMNDLPEFSQENPSAENLAKYIYGKLARKYAGLLQKVTVWETESAAASYWED